MKVFQITPNSVTNNKTNNHQYNKHFFMNSTNDSVNFSGKKLSTDELQKVDSYICNLKAIKSVRENGAKQLKALEEIFTEKVNNLNEKIKPLLGDENFLWAIEPRESKSKFSKFVVDSAYIEGIGYSGEIHNKSWNKVYNSIRNRILSQTPDEIKFEEPHRIDLREHQIKLLQLKDLVAEKNAIAVEHRTGISRINQEIFDKMMPFSSENTDISLKLMYSPTKHKEVEDFNKIIVKRAIEIDPELKDVRDKAFIYYNKEYKDFYSTMSLGKQKQRAANYADQEVISRLEGTTNADRPF